MSQVLLCGHHWPSFTSPGPWLVRVRLGPCLAFSWRSLGLACWAGQSPRSPGSEGGNPSCCKHPLSHILGPFLSSGGSEELLPSHLLLRRPACHCHQHREKQYWPFSTAEPQTQRPLGGRHQLAGPSAGGLGPGRVRKEVDREPGWARPPAVWEGLQARVQAACLGIYRAREGWEVGAKPRIS